MDDKKFQKQVDALLKLQAGLHSEVVEIKESLKELRNVQEDAEKRTNVLERVSLNLYNTSVEHAKSISELKESVRDLRDGQKDMDGRLNAVIFMAERFFSGENGGKSKSSGTGKQKK